MWLRWVGYAVPRKICPPCKKVVNQIESDIVYSSELLKTLE